MHDSIVVPTELNYLTKHRFVCCTYFYHNNTMCFKLRIYEKRKLFELNVKSGICMTLYIIHT